MPYSQDEARKGLDKLFRDIVLNETLLSALDGAEKPGKNDNKNFFRLCRIFADYQRNFYNETDTTYEQEGFFIGSPWHGDPLRAKVLFVGSNPNLTRKCWFPRLHITSDAKFTEKCFELPSLHKYGFFTMGGLTASDLIAVPGSQEKLSNFIDIAESQEFLTQRFQTARISRKKGYLNAWLVKNGSRLTGKRGGVSYWRGLYEKMKNVLSDYPEGETCEAHARRIMAEVLSAEVVPFGSIDEDPLYSIQDKDSTLEYCWEQFIAPLIEYSSVESVYISGGIAQKAYKEYMRRHEGYVCVNNAGLPVSFPKIKHLSKRPDKKH